ncbi:MAG: HAMP domain-containing protein [Hespellia sp.]|nr:HAMP domain-containing protein [Hespellia sp.]
MKQKRLFGVGILLIIAVAAILLVSYSQRELNLHYIEQIHCKEGYLYFVDRGEDDFIRVVRSDMEGRNGDIIACFRYERGKYRSVHQLFFDDAGGVYALVEETQATAFPQVSGAIMRCNFEKGRFENTSYDFTECLQKNPDIQIQGIREEAVYYFETVPDAEGKKSEVKLCSMDVDGNSSQLDSFSLGYSGLKTQFFLSRNLQILWMEYDGEIFLKEMGGDECTQIEGISGRKETFRSLSDDDESTAYVVDYESECIRKIDLEKRETTVVCTTDEIQKQKSEFAFQNLTGLDCSQTGFCAGMRSQDENGMDEICSYQDGKYREVKVVSLTPRSVIRSLFPVYLGIVLVAVLLYVYWFVYRRYRLQTIMVRLILVFVLGLFAADWALERWIEQAIREHLERNQMAALTILGDQLEEHILGNIEKESEILNDRVNREKTENTESGELLTYVYSILKVEEQRLVVEESMTEYRGVPAEWCCSAGSLETVYASWADGECKVQMVEDEAGKWNQRFIPLILDDKTVYGVLSVAVTGELLDYQIWDYQQHLKMVSIAMLSVLSIILIVILLLFLKPLKILKQSANRLAAGELGVTVPVHGHDEIANISATFNQMSEGIAQYVQDIQEMSDGYYKFIPAKILELLGKSSIQEVELGDEMTEQMTILSMHAVNALKQKQRWKAQEIYENINRMLSVPVAAIAEHHGVVEHFEDSGLSAFFTGNSKGALDAAIEIHRSLDKLAYGNGRSIAISYGQVTIGVIGHKNRMEAATISVHSDLAKALRQKGDVYGARILITHLVYQQIADFEKQYHARYLGNIYVSASDTMERIYDVYDGDSEEEFYYKELTKSLFEQGVELFIARKFYEARLVFVEVLKQYRKDKASKEYLYRCDRFYKSEDKNEMDTIVERF